MPAQSSMGLQFGHVLKPVLHFASGIAAVEKDDGVTEAMQFSVSLLFCVYGCVCMSYVLLFHVSQTASQTWKSLCVCVGGGSLLFPVPPAGPGKRLSSLSPSPTSVSFFSSYLV